ncbi:activating signal cointegrator 1 isoform X2 [Monomorium pharaonis]|uniref:activating signal cointegrator 1 isoform X2 n=1 Tax=Monomorium pharaonis TaxID=307658 RepID=UPI001747440C|nr:activating signal cointegrator 1 isoform X2 [Monomorium pharaonis]
MEEWLQTKLSELLDFIVPDDLVQFILQIENERDLDDYLETLVDNENLSHRQFITELKKKRVLFNNQVRYKKTSDDNDMSKKQNDKKKGKVKGKKNVQVQETVKPEAKSEKIEKKKTKFVNLLSHGNVLLKGRHKCDCEANRHALINNCLNCGRIVCVQEGSGPCFFCGELVCSPEEQVLLQSNTKQGDNLYNKLMDQKPNKDLEESLKQRDKLLEFDRNSARRTKVIDDESDYYHSNSTWLSHDERKKLQKQKEEALARKHMSRLDRKVKIDFMGRVVVDEDQSINLQSEDLDCTLSYGDFENINICPTIEFDRPTFVETGVFGTSRRVKSHTWNMESRIQDKEYLEMFDQGLCLSIHQPYASFLVAGIKRHEGRSWYSSHRGRLWIASAAKVPSSEEISNIKQMYRILKKNDIIEFPETYPTSCLLGCITVTDVLPREEYRKVYPEGESDSPYVVICENPYMLPIQFPMKGKCKIYKMDKKIHQAASKWLEKVMKTAASPEDLFTKLVKKLSRSVTLHRLSLQIEKILFLLTVIF